MCERSISKTILIEGVDADTSSVDDAEQDALEVPSTAWQQRTSLAWMCVYIDFCSPPPYQGSMYLESTDLELMDDETTAQDCPSCPGGGTTLGTEQVVGIRFNNILIPKGAALTEAVINLQIDEVTEASALPVKIAIYGEYAGSAAPITDLDFDLTLRPPTKRSVIWMPPDSTDANWGTVGASVQSASVVHILQEIVSHPAWKEGNSVMFLMGHVSGSGVRIVESAGGDNPSLTFSFTGATGYMSIPQSNDADSSEENEEDGSMYLDSSDLELMIDNGHEQVKLYYFDLLNFVNDICDLASSCTTARAQVVGLRFELQVPRGAAITEPTFVVFQVDEVKPESAQPVAVSIYAEAVDSAEEADGCVTSAQPTAALRSGNCDIKFNLSKRPHTTAAVMWQPGTINDEGCEDYPRCGDHDL
jgi:hypothetical protein